MTFEVVVAADEANGIGRSGGLPWRLPGDLAFFKRLTTTAPEGRTNAVIMGRRTWESIPTRVRPLPGRLNVVVSRSRALDAAGASVAASLDEALALAHGEPRVDRVFVIGGGELYREALRHPACGDVHLTRVEGTHACDTVFPELGEAFALASRSERHEDGGVGYAFERWSRRVKPEPRDVG
jgi:dihydrofolate reductase/thymidylate synthase